MLTCTFAGYRFTSDQKEGLTGVSGVTITTYTMIAFSGKRSEESARVMDQIRGREWGLLLMDEVHVVPAQMFRKVHGLLTAARLEMLPSYKGISAIQSWVCLVNGLAPTAACVSHCLQSAHAATLP